MKQFLFAVSAASLLAGAASAATLSQSTVDILDADKLFTTETKVDENVISGGQRGLDVFVRSGATFTGSGANKNWTPGQTYDWLLSYDGSIASLDVGGTTVAYDVLDGTWNAMKIITRAQNRTNKGGQSIFDDAETALTIDTVNGMALATAYQQTSGLDAYDEHTLVFDGGAPITEVGGTIRFAWDAGMWDSSPNSSMAFIVKGGTVELAPIPLPAGLPLLLAGMGALGFLRRRA